MRQDYIDILKGFTIIWVLWMHMNLPEIIYPSVQMPVFFFVSGMFYHAKAPTFLGQLRSDSYKLLMPVLSFGMLAFGYAYMTDTLMGGLDIIKQCLSASITWFLLALFYFRTIAYPCVKKDKKLYVLWVALLIYVPGFYLRVIGYYWTIPFVPLADMGCFMIWFALGLLYGDKVRDLIINPQMRTTGMLVIFTIIYVLIVHCIDWDSGILVHIPWLAYGFPYTFGIIFVMMLGAYRFEKIKFFRPVSKALTYVGKNSIVFYLTHWPFWMYVFRHLDLNIYLSFCCIVLLEFPLIYIFNHYLPWCIGKKYIKR